MSFNATQTGQQQPSAAMYQNSGNFNPAAAAMAAALQSVGMMQGMMQPGHSMMQPGHSMMQNSNSMMQPQFNMQGAG